MSAIDQTLTCADTINFTLEEIQNLTTGGPDWPPEKYQRLESLLVRCMSLYETRQIASEEFGRVYIRLSELNEKHQERVQEIQELFNRAREVYLRYEAGSSDGSSAPVDDSGLFSYCSSIFSGISTISSKISQSVYDLFVDGNQLWKMQKYALGLRGIVQSFQERDIDLLQVKETFESEPSPLKTMLIPIIDFLNRSNEEYEKMRIVYQFDFIQNLRKVITSEEFAVELDKFENELPCDPAVKILLDIIYYRYTDVHIHFFCDQLIEKLIYMGREQLQVSAPGAFPALPREAVLTIPLEDQLMAIEYAPQEHKAPITHIEKGKFEGASGLNFDPHGRNNMPFVSSIITVIQPDGTVKPVKNIRMGTPTKRGGLLIGDPLAIIPEFDLFIRYLKTLKMNFVYFNLQTYWYENVSSLPEWNRSREIVNLSLKYPNFKVVCLPYDTYFYHQSYGFDSPTTREEFRALTFHLMFDDENSGFYFPKSWKEDLLFHNQVIKIFHMTYYSLFNDAEIISGSEKQIFIDIFYVLIIPYILSYVNADIFTVACKDGLDRAGLNNYLLRELILVLNEREEDSELQRIHDISLHGPPMIVKKQEMNGRSKRLLSAKKHLHLPEVKARLREQRDVLYLWGLFDVKIDDTQKLWD